MGKGEGNDNPLLYSCLENSMDRGAWWVAVYGVAQSWTRLKQLSSSSSNMGNESHPNPGSPESLIEDKPKEKHANIHINQTNENKHKEQILKAAREKQQITYKGIPIRLTADLSTETLQARRVWQDILIVMKEKKVTTKIILSNKDHIQVQRRNKKLYRQ